MSQNVQKSVKIISNNPGPTIIGGVIGVQIFNTASTASNVLNETINTGGITAGICTGVQFCFNCYEALNGKYNTKEFTKKTAQNIAGIHAILYIIYHSLYSIHYMVYCMYITS